MAFKHWPIITDLRFANKIGRYLRGARKRLPELDWTEFRRVAQQFKRDDMGSFVERGFLYQLACATPPNAQVIEIGSWMGASTCFLAAGLARAATSTIARAATSAQALAANGAIVQADATRGQDGQTSAKVFAVDNFQGLSLCGEDVDWYQRHFRKLGVTSTLDSFRSNAAALGLSRYMEPVVSDSLAAAERLCEMRGHVDLIFIDGDHSYEGCRADIEAWLPLLKPGGVVAFHDFGSRASGVTQAIFEAIKAGRFAEIVDVAGTIIAFRV